MVRLIKERSPRDTRGEAAKRSARGLSVTDGAIRKIHDMLISGELEPSSRLPPEKQLAEKLRISRNSLREAVRALAVVGILDVKQGDGTYVTGLDPRGILESVDFVFNLIPSPHDLELLEARRIIEPGATALAATRVTDGELAELRRCLERIAGAVTLQERLEADLAFHVAVASASGNETLASLVSTVSRRALGAHFRRAVQDVGALDRSTGEHQAIYEALQARDADLARSANAIHIGRSELWLKAQLSAERDGAPSVRPDRDSAVVLPATS